MLKWSIRIGLVLILVLGVSYLFREQIEHAVMKSQLEPSNAFDAALVPTAPNYATDDAWAALPNKEDGTDFIPDQLKGQEQPSDVAVFFLHPTTYLSNAGWNGPTDDPESSKFRDDVLMRAQASAFNGCCEVYAPKYRQATYWSFTDETGSGEKARAVAYADVEHAFDEFLKRIGDRPFILAGHSQGTTHAAQLLSTKISGTPLKDRMVAAYPIGFGLNPAEMKKGAPDIPVCNTPQQTGCYVTWNSMGPNGKPYPDYIGAVCVNPLSWTTDGKSVAANQNIGSLSLGDNVRYEAGVTGAQCQSDRLLVGDFQSDMFDNLPVNMGEDNYHLLDYSLFYGSIRKNAQDRIEAFLSAK